MTEPLALYIHWPFCVSKCPYCDFNSHVRESVDQEAWREALLKDMAFEHEATSDRTLASIFFGGGTPSLMPPQTVAALLDRAEHLWGFADDIEITLEANPSSVETARFADLAGAGVNRVSLGLQSLNDAALRFLGRAHDAKEGLAALVAAQDNFARVSFDLIYALPGQRMTDWSKQLSKALGFGTSHLSLYQLTIEPGTRFETLARRGELTPKDTDEAAAFYELTQELTEAIGLPAYEISNHARPGAESRHNLAYWRYETYAGIGPGAHGRRGGHAIARHKKPENFLSAIARNGNGIGQSQRLSRRDSDLETLMMGLRLREGVAINRFAPALLDFDAVTRFIGEGLLERNNARLCTTARGRLVLDALLAELIRETSEDAAA